jgi:hypothetical protein
MKKIILVFSLVVLLSSCSSDSSDSNSNQLIKEIRATTGTSSLVFKYFYDGNKITSVQIGNNLVNQYEYEGDLIVSLFRYDYSNLSIEVHYEYDSQNRLIKETATEYQEGASDLRTYTYNADNTITRLSYSGLTANPSNLYSTSKIYLDATGKFFKIQDLIASNWITTLEVTYTDINSPLKNIIGFDKITFLSDTVIGFDTYISYNQSGSLYSSSNFEYTINSSNYPTQRTQTYTNANGGITVSTYEFIYY